MTVAELIHLLQAAEPSAHVVIPGAGMSEAYAVDIGTAGVEAMVLSGRGYLEIADVEIDLVKEVEQVFYLRG